MTRLFVIVVVGGALAIAAATVRAEGTPDTMVDECCARAALVFGTGFEEISAGYQGRRTDGSHAVNGSVEVRGGQTFHCSFDRTGYRIELFTVDTPGSFARAQGTPESMVESCRARAAEIFGARPEAVSVSYQGERTDGTHAVNGSVEARGPETFQCSYDRAGRVIGRFIVNPPR